MTPQPRKQTGPLDATAVLTETVQPPMVECPFCHTMVTYRILYGAVMLDWHRDKTKHYEWCRLGCDYNVTEAQ